MGCASLAPRGTPHSDFCPFPNAAENWRGIQCSGCRFQLRGCVRWQTVCKHQHALSLSTQQARHGPTSFIAGRALTWRCHWRGSGHNSIFCGERHKRLAANFTTAWRAAPGGRPMPGPERRAMQQPPPRTRPAAATGAALCRLQRRSRDRPPPHAQRRQLEGTLRAARRQPAPLQPPCGKPAIGAAAPASGAATCGSGRHASTPSLPWRARARAHPRSAGGWRRQRLCHQLRLAQPLRKATSQFQQLRLQLAEAQPESS